MCRTRRAAHTWAFHRVTTFAAPKVLDVVCVAVANLTRTVVECLEANAYRKEKAAREVRPVPRAQRRAIAVVCELLTWLCVSPAGCLGGASAEDDPHVVRKGRHGAAATPHSVL